MSLFFVILSQDSTLSQCLSPPWSKAHFWVTRGCRGFKNHIARRVYVPLLRLASLLRSPLAWVTQSLAMLVRRLLRRINRYRHIGGETLEKCWKVTSFRLAFFVGRVTILLVCSCYRKQTYEPTACITHLCILKHGFYFLKTVLSIFSVNRRILGREWWRKTVDETLESSFDEEQVSWLSCHQMLW